MRRFPRLSLAVTCVALGVAGALACGSGDSLGPPPVEPPLSGSFHAVRLFTAPLALGDCDGDGHLELVGVASETAATVYRLLPDGILGDKASDVVVAPGEGRPTAAAFADLDLDGTPDLLLGSRGVWFARGLGHCTFATPVSIGPPTACPSATAQLAVTDVDLDGLSDVVWACASQPDGTPLPDPPPFGILLARGDGTYLPQTPPAPLLTKNHYVPFGTFFDDFDGDGVRDYVGILDQGHAIFGWGQPGDEPSFQVDEGLSQVLEQGDAMSLSPLDFDRDGKLEYFIAHHDNLPLLLSFTKDRKWTNRGPAAYLALADQRPTGADLWGTYAFDADFDGWVDILSLRSAPGSHVDGPAVFFHNDRAGAFSHHTNDAVLKLATYNRGLICGDVAQTGQTSCYTDTEGEEGARLISSGIVPVGAWAGVRLVGTVSSLEAEGARVSVSGASPPLVLYYGAQSPTYSQHDRGLAFAVGTATSAAVDITWPSGLVQHVDGLAAGSYTTVTEPQVVSLSARAVPADGTSTVTVFVSPEANGLTGGVSIEKTGGGTWEGPLLPMEHGVQRVLRSPAAAGSARITVRIGQTQLAVRPRVTFYKQVP